MLVLALKNAVDNARLEIEKDGAGDVAVVVCLVEKDVFAIVGGDERVAEAAVRGDAMLLTETLPELGTDYRSEDEKGREKKEGVWILERKRE